jgi:hypothetical protein
LKIRIVKKNNFINSLLGQGFALSVFIRAGCACAITNTGKIPTHRNRFCADCTNEARALSERTLIAYSLRQAEEKERKSKVVQVIKILYLCNQKKYNKNCNKPFSIGM